MVKKKKWSACNYLKQQNDDGTFGLYWLCFRSMSSVEMNLRDANSDIAKDFLSVYRTYALELCST